MKKVVLIDGNNLLFRSFFATAYNGNLMRNSKGFPTNAIFGFINMLHKIIEEEKPEYLMVAFDKGKTFRHEKYDVYKGKRDETPNELKLQFPVSRRLCDAMGIKYFEIDNYEADDIIGTFAKVIDKSDDYEGLIISSDKDLLQLISDKNKVKLLKTKDYIMMDKKEFFNTYGLDDPKKMVDIKSLMGDASDNIPGVKGIGEKTALSLLQKYGSLDGVYENINDISGKTKEKLETDKDNAYLSYEIATIYREVPMDTSIDNIKYLGNNDDYVNILNELEFYSMLKKVETKKVEKEFSYKIVKDLSELELEKEYSFYLEVLGYNYHDAKPLGVSISTSKNNYYVPFDLIKDSNIFNDGASKTTYDLKKVLVIFDKYNISIDKNVNDLMIEAYLLNKNVKNDIAYLANTYDYDINFYDKIFGSEITIKEKELDIYVKDTCKKSSFIYEKRSELLDELKSEDMEKLYLDIELPLVYVLAKMEEEGFRVDKNYLLNMKEDLEKEINNLEKEIYELAGLEFNIASPKQLSDVLFNKMMLPYPKRVKDGNYSTSKDILDKLVDYPIIEKILKFRTLSKLLSNYIIGLMEEIKSDGKIHTIFNQTLTRTGRLSSERPNLQNIPIRLEEGRLIRKAFIPRENSIIISSDYSQIELRVFAHMSHATNMIHAFTNDLDIHAKTASDIFHVPIDEVDKNMRRQAKAVNFGIIYGISGFGLSEDLGINLYEAKDFIDNYLETFPEISTYMKKVVEEAHKNGYVKTLFNRKRVIEELNNKNFLIRSSGERMAMNTPIQGTAADILKMAMVEMQKRIDDENLNSKMLVQVHDELVFDVPENEVEIMKELIRDVMENIYKLDVPLKVDIEYGRTWYEAK
ncbi:MAG: DNA polymerase I [Bacilli bacterium]|nr:DNA polymerase I [Bacilli bacterium]